MRADGQELSAAQLTGRHADVPGGEPCPVLMQDDLAATVYVSARALCRPCYGCRVSFPVVVYQRAPDGKISGMRDHGCREVTGVDVPAISEGDRSTKEDSSVTEECTAMDGSVCYERN